MSIDGRGGSLTPALTVPATSEDGLEVVLRALWKCLDDAQRLKLIQVAASLPAGDLLRSW